jgi:hypothetical protein
MAISRKPQLLKKPTVDVDSLINKGGTPARDANEKAETETAAVVLRLPKRILKQVDALIKARNVRIPRHLWLVEAVAEKIAREQKTNKDSHTFPE